MCVFVRVHVCVCTCVYVCLLCMCVLHAKSHENQRRASVVLLNHSITLYCTWSLLGMLAGQQAPATLPPISTSPTVTSTRAVGMCAQPLTLDDC